MYKTLTSCRACGSTNLEEVFKLNGPQPLSNDWRKPGDERQGFVPLRVLFCADCTLAQLGETVDPDILYKKYLYVTSSSQTMQRHFDRLVKDMASENGKGSLLEVGSNDGLFLKYAKANGYDPVCGIDPAENLKPTEDILTVTGLFHTDYVPSIRSIIGASDTILARHCFCHQEWRPFMDAVVAASHKNTLVCIEVPYAPDLLRRVEFDSIYHEHTSYLTLKSVVALLKHYPFHLHGVIRYGIHGGAVLLMLRHNDSGITPHLSADEMLAEESVTAGDWKCFQTRVDEKISSLRLLVEPLVEQGKIVSAFGASAKASVLINACHFTKKEIQFVTDNSPLKPGRLVPGTDIPVVEEGEMLSLHPDYSIMTAWNFLPEIRTKMSRWIERGGVFIVPSDSVQLLDKNGLR